MSNKIKVYRGLEATIPTLDEGELGYTTDSKKVFIGTDDGNKEIGANGGGTVDWQDVENKPELYDKNEIDLMLAI